MATKENNDSDTTSMTDGPPPLCPPGSHFDPETGTCVPDSGGQEVTAYSETEPPDKA